MAGYQQHYDSVLLDIGGGPAAGPAAAGADADDDVESASLLRDDSHVTQHRLSFGLGSTNARQLLLYLSFVFMSLPSAGSELCRICQMLFLARWH